MKFTPWIDRLAVPVRSGVYQTRSDRPEATQTYWRYWSATFYRWSLPEDTHHAAQRSGRLAARPPCLWRGLTKKG